MKARRKAEAAEAPARSKRSRRGGAKEKLDVQLTVRFNFGDAPQDHVTVVNQRSVPMVGSVLANRDRIMRSFLSLMLKAAMLQPRVVRELFPYLPGKKRPQAKGKP